MNPTHQFLSVVIPTPQVLTLQSNPVLIVPGEPGYLMDIYNLVIKYVANTVPFNPTLTDALTAFTGSGTLSGSLVTYPGLPTLAKGFLDQLSSHTLYLDAWFSSNGGGITSDTSVTAAPASAIVGSGLYLSQFNSSGTFPSGSNWTQGNGSLIVTVEYSYLLA